MVTQTKNETVLAPPKSEAGAELIELINNRIKPNQPLKEDDVFIRKMFLGSDQINSFGGRFDRNELVKMAELVVNAPVLVGHDHQKLPIGRNFKAEIVEKNGTAWLVTNFYWLQSALGAENLAKNIDGGIYKEVSAAFLFETPECSVCGRDIRCCEHIPFRRYALPSGSFAPAFFWYRNVFKVLETSLVFRGAVPGTRITALMLESEGGQEVFTTKAVVRKAARPRPRQQRIYGR